MAVSTHRRPSDAPSALDRLNSSGHRAALGVYLVIGHRAGPPGGAPRPGGAALRLPPAVLRSPWRSRPAPSPGWSRRSGCTTATPWSCWWGRSCSAPAPWALAHPVERAARHPGVAPLEASAAGPGSHRVVPPRADGSDRHHPAVLPAGGTAPALRAGLRAGGRHRAVPPACRWSGRALRPRGRGPPGAGGCRRGRAGAGGMASPAAPGLPSCTVAAGDRGPVSDGGGCCTSRCPARARARARCCGRRRGRPARGCSPRG